MATLFQNMSSLYRRNGRVKSSTAPSRGNYDLLSESQFARILEIERKRTDRSGRSFVLMTLELGRLLRDENDRAAVEKVLALLSASIRDTDIKGWHKTAAAVGVIFTELGENFNNAAVVTALFNKVTAALAKTLSLKQIHEVKITFHLYPDDWEDTRPIQHSGQFYGPTPGQGSVSRFIKRAIDIAGSLCALVFGLPLFLLIAILIKATSKGPVFFKQQRVGQYGRTFQFLKFRSMYVNSSSAVHEDFVRKLIANGGGPAAKTAGGDGYKLKSDARITPLGGFLRKSSLDELPQFFNVLMGDMSLVGPRPPLPYEVKCYRPWHKARLMTAKPGMTGLWQVTGRSRVSFDEMVRMDLRYACSWSVWMDAKILLQTPHAVFSALGAR